MKNPNQESIKCAALRRHLRRAGLALSVSVLIGMLAMLGAPSAEAAVTSCSASIAACGCTITKPGFYQVTADLDSTQGLTAGGNCLEIKASAVTVQVANHSITGPGSAGIGIKVLHGARNVVVNGGTDFTDIEDWSVGLYSGAALGVYSNILADFNDFAGLEFDGASTNVLTDFESDDNGTFGVWVRNGDGNTFTEGDSDNNGFAGMFIGCSKSSGLSGQTCKNVPPSSGNHVIDYTTESNDTYGLALDLGATKQVITDVAADTNGTDDLFDGNPSCDSNLWFDNSFSSASPGCID